jgi:hypothetical protein
MGRYNGWINREYGYWDSHVYTDPKTKKDHTVQKRHVHDDNVCDFLMSFFKEENATVADFGCGNGSYLSKLNESGVECVGYDGNQDTELFTGGLGKTLNLAERADVDIVDWVLALEIAEHIPKKYEHIFVDNIHRHNKKGVIISWALKGQGGYGHHNEQDNDYVKDLFSGLGYTNDLNTEGRLRDACLLIPSNNHQTGGKRLIPSWFKETTMVFRK